ncbi:hypothetical protein PsorP6_000693 [Peronosclerospora sorghi]|uniref:Uncharacterized protein n=1 Tax=Peronosclerospora sorghi TaxID=230839 RepID=A0ACC0WT97_9STRA|nr:hypothetical protein PsorP6_000693 [Peronosclerospora sorghi]
MVTSMDTFLYRCSESIRASSPFWMQAGETLDASMKKLEAEIQSVEDGASSRNEEEHVATVDKKDGLGYTFQVERQSPTVERLPLKRIVVDSDQVMHQVEAMTAIFRFLRNSCAGCSNNQSACLDAGLIKLVRLAHSCSTPSEVDGEKMLVDRRITLLCNVVPQVALQFSVNCVTSNSKNQDQVWKLFFPDHFQVCTRSLIITILQRCIVKPLKPNASLATSPHVDEQDVAFEWICALFRVLFQDQCAKKLYNAVGAHVLSQLWSRVTPEQLILLRMFTMWTCSTLEPPSGTTTKEESDRDQVQLVLENTFLFLKRAWVHIATADDEDRPNEVDEARKEVWMKLENEAKLLLLDGLGDVTGGHITKFDAKEAKELVLSLLEELERVWNVGRENAAPRAAGSIIQSEAGGEPCGYRSRLIRVLGNLCFRHRGHQDIVREKGYLPLFLNHCNVDERNPMIREWCLVALRNLCEGNEANQVCINALRPQGIDAMTSAALEKVNVRARIEENGKVTLT